MIRFFGRKKGGGEGKAKKEGNQEEPLIEMLSRKVKDSDGSPFGEVVSAEEDFVVIKHQGKFYRFPSESVQNRFGELMLAVNIDMPEALRQGEEWRNTGKEVIEENTFYDFTEEKREEMEKKERIMAELKRTREIALQTQSEAPSEEAIKKGESGGEPKVRQTSPRDFAEGKRAEEDVEEKEERAEEKEVEEKTEEEKKEGKPGETREKETPLEEVRGEDKENGKTQKEEEETGEKENEKEIKEASE